MAADNLHNLDGDTLRDMVRERNETIEELRLKLEDAETTCSSMVSARDLTIRDLRVELDEAVAWKEAAGQKAHQLQGRVLEHYLKIEALLKLDECGIGMADQIRKTLAAIRPELTDGQRATIDARKPT